MEKFSQLGHRARGLIRFTPVELSDSVRGVAGKERFFLCFRAPFSLCRACIGHKPGVSVLHFTGYPEDIFRVDETLSFLLFDVILTFEYVVGMKIPFFFTIWAPTIVICPVNEQYAVTVQTCRPSGRWSTSKIGFIWHNCLHAK